MDSEKIGNRNTIIIAILAALVSVLATSFFTDWQRMDDVVTVTEMTRAVEKAIIESNAYTDDRVQSLRDYQETSFEHLEKILQASENKYTIILESIDERLDRIDKRMK